MRENSLLLMKHESYQSNVVVAAPDNSHHGNFLAFFNGNSFNGNNIEMMHKPPSTSRPSTSRRTPSRTLPNSFCAVCGRKAEGRHYNVISCSACKSFFRRSIAYKRKYECKYSKNCSMQRNGQTLCRSCRFKKCHDVGMDPLGIYDYTVKKALQYQTSLHDPNISLVEFKEQIFSSYNVLLHNRKQQSIHMSNFSKTMQNVSQENLIFKQFLINTQLMEFFNHSFVQKKRCLRTWCVLQLLHNTIKFNGLHQNRIYHFDCSFTLLTMEGFLTWYNSSTVLFPHKSCIQRLSASTWRRVIDVIRHFQALNLNDYEMVSFLILAMSTTTIINSSNPKEFKALLTPYIDQTIKAMNAYHSNHFLEKDKVAMKTGAILLFITNFVEIDGLMNEFFLQLSLCCRNLPQLFDFDE